MSIYVNRWNHFYQSLDEILRRKYRMFLMSTVKELCDQSFLECILSGDNLDTNDNYDNIKVLSVARSKDVQNIYKLELMNSLECNRVFRDLLILVKSELKEKIADMIWSYLLYLRIVTSSQIMQDKNKDIVYALNQLYLSIQKGDPEIINKVDNIITVSRKYQGCDMGPIQPDAYTFLKKITEELI